MLCTPLPFPAALLQCHGCAFPSFQIPCEGKQLGMQCLSLMIHSEEHFFVGALAHYLLQDLQRRLLIKDTFSWNTHTGHLLSCLIVLYGNLH